MLPHKRDHYRLGGSVKRSALFLIKAVACLCGARRQVKSDTFMPDYTMKTGALVQLERGRQPKSYQFNLVVRYGQKKVSNNYSARVTGSAT
jgi:hypothetical protein